MTAGEIPIARNDWPSSPPLQTAASPSSLPALSMVGLAGRASRRGIIPRRGHNVAAVMMISQRDGALGRDGLPWDQNWQRDAFLSLPTRRLGLTIDSALLPYVLVNRFYRLHRKPHAARVSRQPETWLWRLSSAPQAYYNDSIPFPRMQSNEGNQERTLERLNLTLFSVKEFDGGRNTL